MERLHPFIFFIFMYSFVSNSILAQNDTIIHPENILEDLMEVGDDVSAANYDDEIIELREKITEPLNINVATKEQLQEFPFLTDLQIENIQAYLYLHGEMKSIYELQLVKGIDWQTIRYFSPFICARPIERMEAFPSLSDLIKRGRHEISTYWDVPFYQSKGYKNKYMGPSYYNSVRYSYRYHDKVYVGICGEKDKGEPFGALYNKKGYDSYSSYILVRNMGKLKCLALGDYRLSFGQGLVISNNFILGKSTYLSTFNRRQNTIGRHSSTDENNFFRGAVLEWAFNKQFLLSAFLSYRRYDATIKEDTITSIHLSGLHRTQKEVDDRNRLGILTFGGNLNYEKDKLQMGITALYYHFNCPYMPTYKKYNKYDMRGSCFYNVGVDYSYRFRHLSFSGEAAVGKKGFALMNSLQYTLSSGYRLMLLHRYYAHNYWAYYARSFSDGSKVQNENGWFVAADIVPFRKVSFFAAVDLLSFPWWKYRVSKPSQGIDILFRTTYSFSSYTTIDFNYRYRRKERDITGTKGKEISPFNQQSFRCKLDKKIGVSLKLRMSADFRTSCQKGLPESYGYQLTQSAAYSMRKPMLQFIFQGSYFHTDDYDTRVYIYEQSQLYGFYIPSYQGTGLRLSFRAQWQFLNNLLCIAHCGRTHYYHQESFGSGNDEVNGNKKVDLMIQVRWKF